MATSGCATYSRIPLTHRDHTQSVRFVTDHLQQQSEIGWRKLAAEQQTLVFWRQVPGNPASAVAAWMDVAMPVAIVWDSTTPQQRVSTATLAELTVLAITRR